MLIRMKESAEGSSDGIEVSQYREGNTYRVSPRLGRIFIERGVAVQMDSTPPNPNKRETKPEPEPETKPEEEPEEKEVEKEPTSEGSAWYQFRDPSGDLITYEEDGEEKVVKVMGEENAEEKRDELQEQYEDDANE